jgi:serine protease SohB
MHAFFSGVYNFLDGTFHLLGGALHVAFWVVLVLIALAVLGNIVRRTQLLGKGIKHGSRHGFFHVHEGTDYERKAALVTRKTLEKATSAIAGTDATISDDSVPEAAGKPIAVIRFDNDMMASYSGPFSRLVNEVIANKERFSKVVVAANSPGGSVAEYGLMYAEMERLRKECDTAGIELIGSIRTYGASGGMLELLPCHKIYASPMAMVGSIGVVSEFLNFHDFWKNLGIQPLTLTAGEFKRTLTPNGEVTPEGKEKFLAQLKSIHDQFIAAVKKYRKGFDNEEHVKLVCSGDHWTAQESIERKLGLIDELATTAELLFNLNQNNDLIFLSIKQNPWEKGIFRFLTKLVDYTLVRAKNLITGGLQ